MTSIEIAGIGVGFGYPTRVVAEIGANHNGSLDLALRLIRESAKAGADFVKFQRYQVREIIAVRGLDAESVPPDPWAAQGWSSYRDLYMAAHTPGHWFRTMIEECRRVGIPWFSSVFGPVSFNDLRDIECPAYKVAAYDALSGMALDISEPVIASSRGERIEWADLTLYCPPGYPQNWGDLKTHEDPVSRLDGLSYHGTDANVPGWFHGLADMIEVHVQLDDTPSAIDAHSSLTVSQLKDLCAT